LTWKRRPRNLLDNHTAPGIENLKQAGNRIEQR
jgi:hypothetical protein